MKVHLTLEIDARTRYIIAKYFAKVGDGRDKTRARATRAQVRRYAAGAVRTAIKEHAESLHRRQRATAERLGQPAPPAEELAQPWEWQGTLPL